MEQELGDGWADGVHSDDLNFCLSTYLAAFQARLAFEMEYRLRNQQGEYRWIEDCGKPLYDLEGNFAGYIGTCFDPALKHIPLVAVTAYAMVGDREKLLAHGFNGYLSKPINPQTFVAEMAPYLRTKVELPAQTIKQSRKQIIPTEGTIMVVDNSPVNIKLAHSILEPFGYKIIEAHGVDEAMQLLAEHSPDVILSDLHMPVKDGFDFIQEVKADDELKKIPFVFISSTVWGDRERDIGLSLGAGQFIMRPIEPRALVAEIETCREKRKARD